MEQITPGTFIILLKKSVFCFMPEAFWIQTVSIFFPFSLGIRCYYHVHTIVKFLLCCLWNLLQKIKGTSWTESVPLKSPIWFNGLTIHVSSYCIIFFFPYLSSQSPCSLDCFCHSPNLDHCLSAVATSYWIPRIQKTNT